MTLENNNLKKKLTDGSFEELYQNTEDFQKLNCAKNAEEVLEILNKYGYNGNSKTLIKEVLELLNEININDLKNVSGGKSLGKKLCHKLGGPALALLAGLTQNVEVTATTASDVQLTTTTLADKLLDQDLSNAKQNKEKHSTPVLRQIVQHISEIFIPLVTMPLINHFRSKNNLLANKPGNDIEDNASSDLPVLSYLYNELKDSLQTKLENLDDLQKGQLFTFINSLLQTINSELHYFKTTNSSSYNLLREIFTGDVLDCRADMLVLDTVEAYLNLSMDVGNLENPKKILTRFQEKLPNSPITDIIEKLVNSTESEKFEVNAFEGEIIDNEYSHQQNEFDDNENEAQQDQTQYLTKKMNYKIAVDYLKHIGYLSDADPSNKDGANSTWTIGDNYADMMGADNDLTLQEHIKNYNNRLESGKITYKGDEQLVFITLVGPENEENGYNF